MPFCIFTDPELARVGLNKSEAQKRRVPYCLANYTHRRSTPHAYAFRKHGGFLKALVGAETEEILGLTAFGPQAGEMMSVVQTAMLGKLPYSLLGDAFLAHPRMAEGLTVLFRAVPTRSIARTVQPQPEGAA